MALGYDGSIRIDTKINSKGFTSGITSMGNSLKKLAGIVGLAFSVTAVVNFSKEAIKVASDLSNAWMGLQSIIEGQGRSFSKAKSFIEDYISDGLVPLENAVTSYKNLAARGYDDSQIQDLMVALKDSAAFGRQSSYTLGEAVQTASEGLKNENSILVDNAGVTKNVAKMWEDYAKSIGTTSANLTDAQKRQAEYEGIMEETRFQVGDAAKLVNTYSGQVAMLSYNFQQLKVAVGNAIMPIVQAVLPGINAIISALTTLANVFAKVTSLLFGKSSGLSGQVSTQKEIASSGSAAANATNDLASATEEAGESAKQAEKDMKGVLAGFDELNILADNTASSLSGAAGGLDDLDISSTDTSGELFSDTEINPELERQLQKLIDRAKELRDILEEGFRFGLGETDLSGIQNSLGKIGGYLKDIFTDSDVATAAKRFVDSFVYMIGSNFGSITSVGATLASLFLGELELFLGKNIDRIKQWIIRMFDVGTEANEIVSNYVSALADVFSVFGGDSSQSIGASIIQIFSDVFMAGLELAQKFGRDIIDAITAPFIENKELIKETLEGFLEPVVQVMESIAGVVRKTVDGIVALYDEHIHPFIMSVKESFTEWYEHVYDGFNTYIKPVLDDFAEKFDEVVKEHVQPMIESAIEFFGKLFDALKLLWDNMLSPIVTWIIDNVVPQIANALDTAGNVFNTFLAVVSDVVGGVFEALNGVLDFLTGVFSTDWEKAWNDVKETFSDLWNGIVGALEGAVNLIIRGINSLINKINGLLKDGIIGKGLEFFGVSNVKINPISEIKIPRLANGAVIPPNQQFAAVLGDQRSGMNLEAPASLIKQMVIEALRESGGFSGEINVTVNSVLDGKVVAKNTVKHINSMTQQAGKPVLMY